MKERCYACVALVTIVVLTVLISPVVIYAIAR
jgi:hypothetical protein